MLKALPATEVSRLPLAELEQLQSALRAYACALLGRAEWVEDIVQNANRYLLEHASNFQPGTNFLECISRRIAEIHTSHFLLDTCGL
jgi:DNA-directed RNA polymerase specialized sigma24 family protein